jgi:predicted methyltransferase
VYDVQYRLDDNLLASHPLADQLRRRGLSSFQHAFDVFLCDPPDTVESYALWLSRAAASLRGASSAMYISTTRIEASAHKWLQFQRMFLASGFIVSDLRRQFTRYPTSEDDFREFDLIPRLHAVHAMQRSAVSWYSSSFVRLLLVNDVAVPMIDGDWVVNELLYTDEEQFPTLPPKALRKLWRVQYDWLRQHVVGV